MQRTLELAKVVLPTFIITVLVEFLLTMLLTFLICLLLGYGWSFRLATAVFLTGLLVNLFVSEHVKLTFD